MNRPENRGAKPAPGPWLSAEAFGTACAALPLVSIDLMVTRPGPDGPELLLGLRNNRPARDWWFTPGGRIRKNEAFGEAMSRVARDEIGLGPECLVRAQLLGAWDHFYPDSAFDPAISTHYVNLPHALHLTAEEAAMIRPPRGPEAQHRAWKWLPLPEAGRDVLVHPHVRAVLDKIAGSVG